MTELRPGPLAELVEQIDSLGRVLAHAEQHATAQLDTGGPQVPEGLEESQVWVVTIWAKYERAVLQVVVVAFTPSAARRSACERLKMPALTTTLPSQPGAET